MLRVGIGTDVHALRRRRPDVGARAWSSPTSRAGLAGHSDGDVAAHAACDALLSAAGLGDLGSNFGTSRARVGGRERGGVPHRDRRAGARGRLRGRERRHPGDRQPAAAGRRGAPRPRRCSSAAVGAPVSVSGTTTDGLGPDRTRRGPRGDRDRAAQRRPEDVTGPTAREDSTVQPARSAPQRTELAGAVKVLHVPSCGVLLAGGEPRLAGSGPGRGRPRSWRCR